MTPIADLATRDAAWLHSGDDRDSIIVSTRIRLARNSATHPFPRTLDLRQQRDLVELITDHLQQACAWPDALHYQVRDVTDPERQALCERQLISRDLASGKRVSALYATASEDQAVMINEEDHVRLQVFSSGLALNSCLERAIALDRSLERRIDWAVDDRFGYLSACPTNTGTGMRASVMLHLPALAETQDLRQILRGLSKLHMTVRGLHGEGSEASGHFYQVSNQRALGHSEHDIVSKLSDAVDHIIKHEQLARSALMDRHRNRSEDRVWRAWGLLTNARSMAYDEVIDQLSWIRLGVALGLLPKVSWAVLDRILLHTQPAHLQLQHPIEAATASSRDRLRAQLIREWLQSPSLNE